MSRKKLDPIPPGEILREEFMRPLGITVTALARDIGVPANRISQIANGKRALSADTALRLGKYFGMSPEIWLDLQSDYDLRLARRTTWKQVEPRVRTRVATSPRFVRTVHGRRPRRLAGPRAHRGHGGPA